jgi:hypothetical protein
MVDVIKIYLDRDHGKPAARRWGKAIDADGPPPPHPPGFRGWVVRKLEYFKGRWHESRTGVTGAVHRVWDWLHARMPPDEGLLADFRRTRRIEVHHASGLADEEVRRLWDRYLVERRRRHTPHCVVNVLIAPFTVLLAPLPGPNFVGYWFAYRSIHHLLILYGLWCVRNGRVDVAFQPVDERRGSPVDSETVPTAAAEVAIVNRD